MSVLPRTLVFVLALGCGSEPSSQPTTEAPTPEAPNPEAPTPEMPQTPTPEIQAPPSDSPYGRIYQLRDDQELREELQRALAGARAKEGKLLIVFGAEWCPDCRQVAKLLEEPPASDVVREGYEVVHVNIGRRDRHRDLLDRYRVERISTLVVLDGTARRVAQTTLEPISNRTGLTSEALAAWLRDPRDPWRRPDRPDPLGSSAGPGSPPDDSPLFPAEIVGGG
ncbi:MAG: thioredoxin family protein [Sandaracinus sp.]|nr:thioredoxin family protein [Sandaracinus sp.]MCB9620425.1 thioredoxin family protein [Sandaracinus sp.]MCB9624527.1 thioredoxin family protein [Sandaracinus sp.]